MTPPSERKQIEFLAFVQRVLTEGLFTASYKFALLLALADLSVELGDDSGDELRVPLDTIADKFVGYYWRQTVPYVPRANGRGKVLLQNQGKQAAIINAVVEARHAQGASLVNLQRQSKQWRSLRRKVRSTIRTMPLFKLQRLGPREVVEHLYLNQIEDGAICLRPGIAYCFRRFHGLLQNLVTGAWLRFIRSLPDNQKLLGEASDLSEFLFGSERSNLSGYVAPLRELQADKCFYCGKRLARKPHVDHFVPWSWFASDNGYNFVLADDKCNAQKSNALAAVPHLKRWRERNAEYGAALAVEFDAGKLPHDMGASTQVARWAYEIAEMTSAQAWLRGKTLVAVDGWRGALGATARAADSHFSR